MKDRPPGLGEEQLSRILARGWRIDANALRYAPVGNGSFHWVAADARGGRWFVTVDDLDGKGWLGADRASVGAGLRAAMDTAWALRHDAGLRFVLAPVPAEDGATVLPVSPAYAVAVFPFVRRGQRPVR